MAGLNGRLNAADLTLVDGWAYLERKTARAWLAACNKMVRLGFHRPALTAPDGAYRNIQGQIFWKDYWTDRGKPYNAATPGTSAHGYGTAGDIFKVYLFPKATLRAVFQEFGFRFNVPTEDWHISHDGRDISDSAIGGTQIASTATPIQQETNLSAAEVKQIMDHITAETERLADYVRRESRLRLYKNNQATLANGAANPRFGQVRAMNITTGVDIPVSEMGQLASLRTNGYSYIGDGDFDRPQLVDDQRFRNVVKDCADVRKSLGGSGIIASPNPFLV